MAILVDSETRLIIQGITGREGRGYAEQMIAYGTQVVAGVTPGKGGEWVEGKPVFDTVRAAIDATEANASLIAVPAPYAPDAIYEAIAAGIEIIVCLTEGIPVMDMIHIYEYTQRRNCYLIGPNCPGVLTPGQSNVGIIPTTIAAPGNIGVVSKSGSLTYQVIYELTKANMGQSTCVGIGGDPITGISFIEVLEMFHNDPDTEKVVMIGEIGGEAEITAAEYIKYKMTKPVVGFIAGRTAPPGQRMGHAGAIYEYEIGTVEEKIAALQDAGVRVAEAPEHVPHMLLQYGY